MRYKVGDTNVKFLPAIEFGPSQGRAKCRLCGEALKRGDAYARIPNSYVNFLQFHGSCLRAAGDEAERLKHTVPSRIREAKSRQRKRNSEHSTWHKICVELQRPGKYAEMLVPHDPF